MDNANGNGFTAFGNGRFEVRGVLNRGGFGTIYLVYDRVREKLAVVKMLHTAAEGFGREQNEARFRNEWLLASAVEQLDPGFAHVIDQGSVWTGGTNHPFFAMNLVDGRDLAWALRNYERPIQIGRAHV